MFPILALFLSNEVYLCICDNNNINTTCNCKSFKSFIEADNYYKNAIELLKENQDKIDWDLLCLNENAIELLKENPEKIYWENVSENKNIIKLLEINDIEINWDKLSKKSGAIKLLKANPNKIDWDMLSINKKCY